MIILTKEIIRKMLDVTFLDMSAEPAAFTQFLHCVQEIKPIAACVQPCMVSEAKAFLREYNIGIASVIAFPAGGSLTKTKVFEAARAIEDGATEIDMVIDLSAVRKKDKNAVSEDIAAVVEAAKGHKVKVIIEAPILSDEEKEIACQAIVNAKANFVKTCSGFASNRADASDIATLRKLLPGNIAIKASGQVGNLERITELYDAGACRFGVLFSQAKEILSQCHM